MTHTGRETTGTCWSITVRPTDGIENRNSDYQELIKKYIEKLTNVSKYLFTIEKQGSAGSHVQGLILYQVDRRQDNVRRWWYKTFAPSNENERLHMHKIHSHNNYKLLVGYCCKENIPFITNLTTDEINEGKEYYSKEKRFKEIKLKKKDPNDMLIEYMEKWVEVMDVDPKRLVVSHMLAEMVKQRLLLPSQYVKIKQEAMQSYWDSLHGSSITSNYQQIVSEGGDILGMGPHPERQDEDLDDIYRSQSPTFDKKDWDE